MELSLIRSLMDRSFYDDHRGARCPDRLFSKDVRKITFEWPFERTLSSAIKARPTSKDAEFCPVHSSYQPFFRVRSTALLIHSFLRSETENLLIYVLIFLRKL